ncbi:MAG: hypothetical protein NTY64_21680, partial [Deltaproteobacteria bacterium]|nr:hypothetical protein [Deltaproteobacteria bacterium]
KTSVNPRAIMPQIDPYNNPLMIAFKVTMNIYFLSDPNPVLFSHLAAESCPKPAQKSTIFFLRIKEFGTWIVPIRPAVKRVFNLSMKAPSK